MTRDLFLHWARTEGMQEAMNMRYGFPDHPRRRGGWLGALCRLQPPSSSKYVSSGVLEINGRAFCVCVCVCVRALAVWRGPAPRCQAQI